MVAVPRDTDATSPPGEGGSQFSVFPEFKLSQSNESVHKCAEAHWEPFLPEKKSPSSEMDLDLHNSLAAVALRLLHRETWSKWEEPFSSWGRALEYGGHVLHECGTAGSDLAPLITQGLSQGTLHTCGQQRFCTLWATQAYIPWALHHPGAVGQPFRIDYCLAQTRGGRCPWISKPHRGCHAQSMSTRVHAGSPSLRAPP